MAENLNDQLIKAANNKNILKLNELLESPEYDYDKLSPEAKHTVALKTLETGHPQAMLEIISSHPEDLKLFNNSASQKAIESCFDQKNCKIAASDQVTIAQALHKAAEPSGLTAMFWKSVTYLTGNDVNIYQDTLENAQFRQKTTPPKNIKDSYVYNNDHEPKSPTPTPSKPISNQETKGL